MHLTVSVIVSLEISYDAFRTTAFYYLYYFSDACLVLSVTFLAVLLLLWLVVRCVCRAIAFQLKP